MACTKLIEEEVVFAFDFKNLDEIALFAETLASVVSVTFTPTDPALVLNSKGGSPTIVGTQVQLWIKGGSAGQTYVGTCKALTSAGKTIASRMPLLMLD